MPLSVQPREWRNRKCLVSEGSEELRRAYENLFVKGHSGIIKELQMGILEFGKLLRSKEIKKDLTPKDQLRYLKDLTSMLANLEKVIEKLPKDPKEDEDDKVLIDSGEKMQDPESLIYSSVVKEMLPSMKTEVPPVIPEKVETETDKIMNKLFPKDEAT
jgi:hypothetical protein